MKDCVHWLYLANRLLCSPLEVMFTLLIFIISKDAGATPLQAAVLVASKPTVSLIAFYANSLIIEKPSRVRLYLIVMNLLGCLPCFFFAYYVNPWFFVASFALFTASARASFPAWTQILKNSVGLKEMNRSISRGSSINYAMILLLPPIVSYWMDLNRGIWTLIYALFALLYLLNLLVLFFLEMQPIEETLMVKRNILRLTTPWRDAWRVLRESTPFAKYLLVFFLGGAGIVMMQSILPTYFKEDLNLSYTQLSFAFSFCKGLSFLVTSPYWARYANQVSLYFINGVMNCFTCLFIVFLLTAKLYLGWLYLAYLMYGSMQAGCEISWNFSGPLFSKEKPCTSYSNVNLVLVGIRGCICPALSQLIFASFGKIAVFGAAFAICFIGLLYAFWVDRAFAQSPEVRVN
ncbi:MAG: MFS transporter [Chlamydiales bacterium]